jgi:transposase InsO family protein
LNCIDHYSKKAWAFPLKTRDSELAAAKMRQLFEEGHVPSVLHADNEFASSAFVRLCEDYGCKLIRSPPYAPWANGCIERFNRTLKTSIKVCVSVGVFVEAVVVAVVGPS